MTENLAARGEGLARLGDELNQCLQIIVTNAGNIVSFNAGAFRDEDIHGAALAIEKAVDRAAKAIRAALEAAAPAGTAPLKSEVACVREFIQWAVDHIETDEAAACAEQATDAFDNILAALATPSPQAPPNNQEGAGWSDAAATQEQPAGSAPQWNIEQILVYIWQCIGGEDSDPKEYPYSQFAESEGGKLLRSQLEGLPGSPRKVGEDGASERIWCMECGKSVSTPVPKDTIVRAWVQCPECIEKGKGLCNSQTQK